MDRPDPNRERIYRLNVRFGGAIGRDVTRGCFIPTCTTARDALMHNCSFFVPSRETGEAVVALFFHGRGARLDYRDFEPNWIQVKIGACNAHKMNLEGLVRLVEETRDRNDGPGINATMIQEAISLIAVADVVS